MDFKAKFDKAAVLDFLKNQFLPDDFEENWEIIKFDQLSFAPERLKGIEYVGESNALGLKLYVVQHDSENDPRVMLSRETFRVMSNLGAQRALVVYHSAGSGNYRLSLATITLALKGARTKREYSNPRRYSFFLGPDAKTHTPEQFLSRKVKDYPELLGRFSIEVVNEEFYKAIARKFTALVGGKRKSGSRTEEFAPVLHLPSVDLSTPAGHTTAQEFAVRLIGRIVFCWFLKKKKSPAGVPLLPDSILSTEAAKACIKKNESYLHSVLENVFFQVLNTETSERAKELCKAPYDKIPFLNGGLFEPHNDDSYEFDSFTATSKLHALKIDNAWFYCDDDQNPGLLNILESYNFTIDENTSVDVELAVDPEMLGRIFENLLAEINPETGETARKSTGSFYTPRHIVEYMVDESLKEYLKLKTNLSDEKISGLLSYSEDVELSETEADKVVSSLDGIKIIDPACGSGAFPMGMLQKIVLVLQKVDPKSEKWLEKQVERIPDTLLRKETLKQLKSKSINYIRKMGVLRDCIYGVDIQETATEISKLRFFLSLIIDEDVDDAAENRGIEPLPNLEFKFVCANTLISLPSSDAPELFEDESSIKRLKNLREQYFRSSGKDKVALKEKFIQEQKKIFNKLLLWHHSDTQSFRLSTWKPFENKPSPWFDPEWMFGAGKSFDVVIGNPPYLREKGNAYRFEVVNKSEYGKKYHQGKMDFWFYFLHKAIDLCKNEGIISFITSRYWINSTGASKLIRRVRETLRFLSVVDIGKLRVFDNVAGQHMVSVYCKTTSPEQFTYKRLTNDTSDAASSSDTSNVEIFRLEHSKVFTKNDEINFNAHNSIDIPGALLLGDTYDTSIGIQESPDRITKKMLKGYTGKDINAGDGVFVLTEEELRGLGPTQAELSVIKRYVEPNDIQRYNINPASPKHIIYSDAATRELIQNGVDFKNLKAHLDKYQRFITSSNKPYGLHRPRKQQYFVKPKIIFKGMFTECEFAIDDTSGYYFGFSFSSIIQKEARYPLKYLLALLNSKFALWWFLSNGKKRGKGVDIGVEKLRLFPVKVSEQQITNKIIGLVDEIMLRKKHNQQTTSIEAEIDALVLSIYGLKETPEGFRPI